MTTIPDEALPYVQALRDLMRTGVEAAPSLQSSCLLDLPIVAQAVGADAMATQKSIAFITSLKHVIDHRLSGKDRETAKLLFAIDEHAGIPMQDRYHQIARLYNPHWTWDNFRKEPLTRHLLAVYFSLARESDLTSTQRPTITPTGFIGQDWDIVSNESHFILPTKDTHHVKQLQTITLKAKIDEASFWRQRFRWLERGTTELPHMEMFNNDSVMIAEEHQMDVEGHRLVVIHVQLAKPVPVGKEVTLRLIKYIPVAGDRLVIRQLDWYGFTPMGAPAHSLKAAITFPRDRHPKQLWLQEGVLDGITRPGEPNENNQLRVDENGYVEAEWHNTSAGYAYGISLRWY